ncbi:hypothetical protein I5M32_15530 [Pedobacter sp. SD-b]|uniref:Uncharacterized protein n=1 Tax=Pedobacter segetis TaxID=2793069 RepID=A0ABS1BNA9_9SPHI|nr:hypothetical protein [Pedobacter segetis]MBK0384378.1 hypothetical protein [Pedobacter segetis]
MSGKIENFIKNNKKAFDDQEPSAGLWDKIDAQLDAHCKEQNKKIKRLKVYNFSKIAAIFIVVLAFGFLWGKYQWAEAVKLENINPAYAAKEVQFSSLIDHKRAALKDLKKIDPQLYQTFKSEQLKLEKEYKSLQKELSTSPNQDRIVKAMIRNLQSQIDLLNQQLNITKEVKQFKASQNETAI